MVITDLGEFLEITEPCRLCRKQSIIISGEIKYCVICYKELIAKIEISTEMPDDKKCCNFFLRQDIDLISKVLECTRYV